MNLTFKAKRLVQDVSHCALLVSGLEINIPTAKGIRKKRSGQANEKKSHEQPAKKLINGDPSNSKRFSFICKGENFFYKPAKHFLLSSSEKQHRGTPYVAVVVVDSRSAVNSKDVSYSYYIMIFRPIIVNTTRQTGFPLRFFFWHDSKM